MLYIKILLRSILRKLGLSPFLAKFFYPKGYETNFDNALLESIRSGDVVWDVGANVGHYTKKFSALAGPEGTVYAFEPIPDTFEILSEEACQLSNVKLFCMALGASDETLSMTNRETKSVMNKIILDTDVVENTDIIKIVVAMSDGLIERNEAETPNVIKIDVEGHEADVLAGMPLLLADKSLHTMAIEIHFAWLEERGQSNAPKMIVNELKKNNFHVQWTDPSHVVARRK